MARSKQGVVGVALATLAGLSVMGIGAQQLLAQGLFAQGKRTITVVFPSRANVTDLQNKANAVVAFLSKETGMNVQAQIADDTAAVEALRANRADVAFLSSRPALKAEKLTNARMFLAEVRSDYSGGHTYDSVFVVPKNSPLKTGQTKATLQQMKGKRMSFTSPTSGSGFIFPVSQLVRQGFVPNKDRLDGFFGQVTYGGNYSKALQAVVRGQADVAAVSEYALNPPYITPQERSQLRVLYKISGVPAHGIVFDDDVSASDRSSLIRAMLKLNQPANNGILRNLYNSTRLVSVNHSSHLAPVRNALKQIGIEP